MEEEQVKESQLEPQVGPQIEPQQDQINTELEKLKLENEQLKTQLARAEFEKDEAQKAFLNRGNEVKQGRDYKSIVEDIE